MIEKMGVPPSLSNEILHSFGMNPETGDIDPRGPLIQASEEDEVIIAASILYRKGYAWDRAKEVAGEAFREANNLYTVKELTKPVPGAIETLKNLKKAGLKIAVATLDDCARTLKVLEIIGIRDDFDLVLGKNNVASTKPSPEMILTICSRLDINPGDTVIVGDSVTDMMMGKAARVALTVGILNGVNCPDNFSDWADVTIQHLSEIKVVQ